MGWKRRMRKGLRRRKENRRIGRESKDKNKKTLVYGATGGETDWKRNMEKE